MAEFLDSEAAESEVLYCLHKTRAIRVQFRLSAYAFCVRVYVYMYVYAYTNTCIYVYINIYYYFFLERLTG